MRISIKSENFTEIFESIDLFAELREFMCFSSLSVDFQSDAINFVIFLPPLTPSLKEDLLNELQ